jgi:hypothetical protein
MREISNLEIKIQLTNEYLRTGGVEKISDVGLLEDLLNVKFVNGKALPETITSRLNAFMQTILFSHTMPPVQIDNSLVEYASFIQKSIFFDQYKIETKEEVDELFAKFDNIKNILFRGQIEAKWRLYSKLQRFWIWDEMKQNGEDYLDFLKKIIDNGRDEFGPQITKILSEINIDSLNDISVLGYLQHHNCPTPLLDWTYNFKAALFFGIDGIDLYESSREIDKYFSVYFIEEEHFDVGGMRTLLNETLHDLSEQLKLGLIEEIAKNEQQKGEMETHFRERSFFAKDKLKGSGLINHMTKIERMINIPISFFSDKDIDSEIVFSLTNSANIKKQEGVFTWNSDSSKPLEIVGNEQYSEAKLESEPDDYRFCQCYNINKNLAVYINQKLDASNISKDTMYPDKDIDTKHIYENNKRAKA